SHGIERASRPANQLFPPSRWVDESPRAKVPKPYAGPSGGVKGWDGGRVAGGQVGRGRLRSLEPAKGLSLRPDGQNQRVPGRFIAARTVLILWPPVAVLVVRVGYDAPGRGFSPADLLGTNKPEPGLGISENVIAAETRAPVPAGANHVVCAGLGRSPSRSPS